MIKPSTILNFWFKELKPEQWFTKDKKLDNEIRNRFGDIHESASKCELFSWRTNIKGRLAEIIILDQFSRNIYRGDPRAFAQDPLALALSQEAILIPEHKNLSSEEKLFLYLPFMHSESKLIHEEAIKLFSEEGLEKELEYEILHKNIIDRFGRYPHRNEILGRESTEEEIEFLKSPNSSF